MAEGGATRGEGPAAMCPMAMMCMGVAGKRSSGLLMMVPGIVLVLLGVLILVWPKVLVWLMAGLSIILGLALLAFANAMRAMGARFRGSHG